MMSDFKPEVEIKQFCTCALKNLQYNLNLCPNRRNSGVLEETGGEHNGDVRFQTGSRNKPGLRTEKYAVSEVYAGG